MKRNNLPMDKDEIIAHIIAILVVVVILAITTILSAWIFNTIMASDMPDWLKYILLK